MKPFETLEIFGCFAVLCSIKKCMLEMTALQLPIV